ncbi:Interferon-induced GTP-binding protein Mx1 [Grifola frondosa]|uniref:Interferon-induced GTP-binding protein Mx1 n=1 Tax=Grifola frondosa TaxID=5627 RepID=A0A1C7MIA6_GRIFR|nr:Interferon-induced GTP-binding protein Mx1 [Grifola frondosa]
MLSSFSQLSADSDYAKRRKELLALIKQLRAIGAQADLDLPRIAVIGNQSAGKSSLVEAISGINVPRDAGTCTRCPMECRMSLSSGPWSCQISIRWEFDNKGSRRAEVEELPFGGRITDKTEVELMLRRAQAAVLNPTVDPSTFLKMSGDILKSGITFQGQKPLLFSKNAVCIDLLGPELTDLSFVDLPGIVQNAESEIVQLIEDLVTSHISGNCLILITLPMSDDIENQKAARLARQVDPSGLRTIGVMTKPDTLPSGSTKSRDLWLDVIEGRKHSLTHGYYCTRQPDDDERALGISGPEARAAEAQFFARTPPWCSSAHQHRFGTTNLVQSLSKLLTQVIDDALPKLQGQVALQLANCNMELDKLPRPITTEPSAFMLTLITSFCQEVDAFVRGTPNRTSLVQTNRQIYTKFKLAIRSSAPPFMPYESAAKAPKGIAKYIIMPDEDEKDVDSIGEARLIYLKDVRSHIEGCISRELPNNVPYAAKVSLIQAFQRSWEQDTLACFDNIHKEFQDVLGELIRSRFDLYGNLKAVLGPIVMELVNCRRELTLTYVHTLLKLETTPFTQNTHYLSEKKDKALAHYKDARAGKRKPERVSPSVVPQSEPPKASGFGPNSNAFAPYVNAPKSDLPFPIQPFGTPTSQSSQMTKATNNTTPALTSAAALAATPWGRSLKQDIPGLSGPFSSGKDASFSFTVGRSPQPSDAFGVSRPLKSPFGVTVRPADSQPKPANPPATSLGVPESSQPSQAPQTCKAPPPLPATPVESPSHAFTGAVFEQRVQPEEKDDEKLNNALAALAELGYHITPDALGKLNAPDEYEGELELMAEVRAYFQVAYKRVIDYIPLSIDHLFLYTFAETLQAHLIDKLGLGSANAIARCTAYLAEDPYLVSMREELESRKKRMESVQKELFNFGL